VILVEDDTLKLDAGTVPKRTLVAPLKLVPLTVTLVPPPVGPLVGEMEVTEGTVRTEVNTSPNTKSLVPAGVVTRISYSPAACAGATAVITVEDDTLKLDAGTVPKRTLVAPVNPVPFMVTDVPPVLGPEAGEIEERVGAGTGGDGASELNQSALTCELVPLAVVTVTL
jgi:hypothetical protein